MLWFSRFRFVGECRDMLLRELAATRISATAAMTRIAGIVFVVVCITAGFSQSTYTPVDEIGSRAVSKLNAEFARDPALRTVRAEMSDEFVHLRGTVTRLQYSRDAVKRVLADRRIKGVFNHIVVQSEAVPDAVLRGRLENTLNTHGIHAIKLSVKRGLVHMRGTVSGEEQHERILTLLCNTSGVKELNDEIQIQAAQKR